MKLTVVEPGVEPGRVLHALTPTLTFVNLPTNHIRWMNPPAVRKALPPVTLQCARAPWWTAAVEASERAGAGDGDSPIGKPSPSRRVTVLSSDFEQL